MLHYNLMHRDIVAAKMTIDDRTDALCELKIINEEQMPYLGCADIKKMQLWLKNRTIPEKRSFIEDILSNNDCASVYEYLYKNLALSMTDSYWTLPEGSFLKWEDVNLYDNAAKTFSFGHEYSFSPNATLGGQMPKYIDLSAKYPVLVKQTKDFSGLQCYNEVLASNMHKAQNWEQYVAYEAEDKDDITLCKCGLFTDKDIEFVSAYEVMCSKKQKQDISGYDHYISICKENGITDARIFMDYMTLSDFAITNTDRHLNNFGILRNADTLICNDLCQGVN